MITAEGHPKVHLAPKEFAAVYVLGLLRGIWLDGSSWRDDLDPATAALLSEREVALVETQVRAMVDRCFKTMKRPLDSARKKIEGRPDPS